MLGDVGGVLVPGHDYETGLVLVELGEQVVPVSDHPADQVGRLPKGEVRYPV